MDLSDIRLKYPCDMSLAMPTQSFGGSHSGWDVGSYGQAKIPIFAAADGVVTFAGLNSYGYGIMVELTHGNGFYKTKYAHLESFIVVNGLNVKAGDTIGTMGTTGNSTGVHLHFELIVPSKPIPGFPNGHQNPEPFFAAVDTPNPPGNIYVPPVTKPMVEGSTVEVTSSDGAWLHFSPDISSGSRIVAVPKGTKFIVQDLDDPFIEAKVYIHKDLLRTV